MVHRIGKDGDSTLLEDVSPAGYGDSVFVALDIETTSLSPREGRLRAVGLFVQGGGAALASDDEHQLLRELETAVRSLPDDAVIVTWNGEEFDLPFLSTRYALKSVETSLRIAATRTRGKYGKPAFTATWAGHAHVDIASSYEEMARRLGIAWSLKPVARELLGADPLEVDRRGISIEQMNFDLLERYVLSDAEVTFQLALKQGQVWDSPPAIWKHPVGV